MEKSPNDNVRPAPASTSLHERAEQNLQIIRELMEGSVSFTGVSGTGYTLAGLSAAVAAWIAARQVEPGRWLLVWMIELALGLLLTFSLTIAKARRQGESLWSTTGKKLLLAFLPPMFVGAVLTVFLALQEATHWLPGIWLSLYGAAVIAAGAHSVPVIPLMGLFFLGLGSSVLLFGLPGDLMLGLGLGGLHVIFGLLIWRNYGG
ncbi:MAG: hypothetical protein R3F41_10265 [Gammaproteobacteria bacterium]|nr:hypothetical protein [Pseudomonadales bacterium]MCP5347989.1 hypothetical protein [Pseudomonadales bacterium]